MTTFSTATLEALHAIATEEEIEEVLIILRQIESGYFPSDQIWRCGLIRDIIQRLAQQAGQEVKHGAE